MQPKDDTFSTIEDKSPPANPTFRRTSAKTAPIREQIPTPTASAAAASSCAHRYGNADNINRRSCGRGSGSPEDHGTRSSAHQNTMALEDLPRYDKAVASDKRLGRAMMLSRSRKYREQTGKVILEGRRLISDALQAGAKADSIFFSQVANIQGLPLQGSKVSLVKVAYKDIKLWSELSTPQGIVGVFRQPNYETLSLDSNGFEERLPMILICDNIRDPGNLGTILRSAAAAACRKVLVSKGCVDVWEPKVLRSGAGAHFRIPVISNITWSSIPNFLEQDSTVHIADCNSPMPEPKASCHSHTEEDTYKNEGSNSYVNSSTGARSLSQKYEIDEEFKHGATLRMLPYFGLSWVTGPCALVVGGETEGLSEEALELCSLTGGQRVHIPMSLGVDSLNAAMATSIILFEAKRQFLVSGNR